MTVQHLRVYGIVKKKILIVLHQRGEAVRKSGSVKNCGKIAENCGNLRKIAENCEKLRNCGKLRKIADLNAPPPPVMAQRNSFGGWRPEAVLLCTSVLDDHQATEWWRVEHVDRSGDILLNSMMAIAHQNGLLHAFIASKNQLLRDRCRPPRIWYKPDPQNETTYQNNCVHRNTPQCIIHPSSNTIQSLCELSTTHGTIR